MRLWNNFRNIWDCSPDKPDEPAAEPQMLYSWESTNLSRGIGHLIGEALTDLALERTKAAGRKLVTECDVEAIIEEIGLEPVLDKLCKLRPDLFEEGG